MCYCSPTDFAYQTQLAPPSTLLAVRKIPQVVFATASGAKRKRARSIPATTWYRGLELRNMKPAQPRELGIRPGSFFRGASDGELSFLRKERSP